MNGFICVGVGIVNHLRLEKENNEAHEVVNQLRDDVVKKQNEIIKEKKEQDKLRKDVEQAETENTDLTKQISQLEKKVTDQRLRFAHIKFLRVLSTPHFLSEELWFLTTHLKSLNEALKVLPLKLYFSSKDTEKLCREQKIDIEKKSRENKIIQERINKLKVKSFIAVIFSYPSNFSFYLTSI